MKIKSGYTLVYSSDTCVDDIFPIVKDYLQEMYDSKVKMAIVDRPSKERTIDEIIEFCRKYKKSDFCLDNDIFCIDFRIHPTDRYASLLFYTKNEIEENFSKGLQLFVGGQIPCKKLITATVYSFTYSYIQNEKVPENLTYYGVDLSKLVIKDLGYRKMIDTSNHPGRCYSRIGYIEEVCSEMYITRELCKRTGADYEQIKTTDWLKTDEVCEGVLHLVAWSEPFTSAEGEQAEVQNRLRKLLFPLSYDKKENWRL